MQKPQLFLLHFAGGNCHSFNFMIPLLKEFHVVSLELPGRGKRINEALLIDFDLAAKDIYEQIVNKLTSSNFLIYGHSMGAYLALKATHMLEKQNIFPSYVIVSGNPGPGIKNTKERYLLPDEEFIQELKNLGGIPKEVFENTELLDFCVPILRADFQIAETNVLSIESIVNTPIYAMMGNQENEAGRISNWGRFTSSQFNFEILEGDHFFIHKNSLKIAHIIKNCYKSIVLMH
ncbi:MAG TPA: alpha/beta fold hydrolase [Chitinophagales bacterium]|nr:alpha/beta fold hydrolase [Chitinophagales bacterium]